MSAGRRLNLNLDVAAALVLFLFICACGGPQGDFYEAIPTSNEYPRSENDLQRMIDNNDSQALRKHAWQVFAELTKPSHTKGIARWETWYDVDEAFAPQDVDLNKRTRFARPLAEAAELESACLSPQDPHQFRPAAFILYNREAYQHIRNNRLYLKQTLESLHGDVPAFPAKAIVVKTHWVLAARDKPTFQGVWDGERLYPGNVRNFPDNFPRQVCIAQDTSMCTGDTPSRAPISSFYNFQIDAERLSAITKLDAFANAKAGDYAILLGLHYATREQENWVWASFWWHDRPSVGPFGDDRPSSIRAPWSHYLMTTSYDMDKPREPDGKPHIAFNPYLEAAIRDGVDSNCMTCHRRATWPLEQAGPNLLSDGSIRQIGLPGTIVRGTQSATQTYFNTPFEDHLKVSFLWSLVLRAIDTNGKPGTRAIEAGMCP